MLSRQDFHMTDLLYIYLPTLFLAYCVYKIYRIVLWPLISPLSKIPSMPYNPIFGNTKEISKAETTEYSLRVSKKLGPVARYFFFFGFEIVSVTGPEEIKHVLVTRGKNYDRQLRSRKLLECIAGYSILASSGPDHAAQRKLLNPSFSYRSIRAMVVSFQKYGQELNRFWKSNLEKNGATKHGLVAQPIQKDLGRTMLDVIGECAFGYEFNSIWEPEKKLTQAFADVLQLGFPASSWKILIPFYQSLPLEENRRFKAGKKIVRQAVQTVIEHRKNEMKEGKEPYKDLLSVLMMAKDEETGQGLSDTELTDHVMTFMFAGQETTSTGLIWTLYLLSQHPEIQDKVRKEILEVLPNNEDITWEHLDKLQYLKAVISESLRLFPPVAAVPEVALQDDKIGDYFIPKGTYVLINTGAMHRNPNVWPDPETFNPERFTDPNNPPKPYTYLPFSIGRRNCIGSRFALIGMRVILSTLLRDLQFSLVPGTSYKRTQRITMRPKPPMQLQICKV